VEEALYDSRALRHFVGIDLGREPVPVETTICKFRHLMETHRLGEQLFARIGTYRCQAGPAGERWDHRRGDHYQCPQFDEESPEIMGSRDASDEEGPQAQCFIQTKAHRHRPLTKDERARNRTKSKVRAKVEHAVLVIKRVFRWAKDRYCGWAKNTHGLFISCGLANLYVAQRAALGGT
jgi:IS5 family transposase